jgi:hypothetical protein
VKKCSLTPDLSFNQFSYVRYRFFFLEILDLLEIVVKQACCYSLDTQLSIDSDVILDFTAVENSSVIVVDRRMAIDRVYSVNYELPI